MKHYTIAVKYEKICFGLSTFSFRIQNSTRLIYLLFQVHDMDFCAYGKDDISTESHRIRHFRVFL